MKKLTKKDMGQISFCWGTLFSMHLALTDPAKTIVLKAAEKLEKLILKHEIMTSSDFTLAKTKSIYMYYFDQEKIKKIGKKVMGGVKELMEGDNEDHGNS